MSNGGKKYNAMQTAHRYREISCAGCGAGFVAYGTCKVCDACKALKAQTPEAVQKAAAQRAVVKAVRDGSLVRQNCELCVAHGGRSQRGKSHGHHEDYSQPLQVIWLCSYHHIMRHAALRNGAPAVRSADELITKSIREGREFRTKYPTAKLPPMPGDKDFVPSNDPYQIL
jgi:hypothetical protein